MAAFPALALRLAAARLATVPGYYQSRLTALVHRTAKILVAYGCSDREALRKRDAAELRRSRFLTLAETSAEPAKQRRRLGSE